MLHPALCLEAKLANLSELAQEATGRQDHKHARLSCLCLRVFIARCLAAGQEREARGLTQRILTLAGKQNALRAWYDHGLGIEESIPLPEIQAAAQAGESKLGNFLLLNWGRLQGALEERRTHFETLMQEQGRPRCPVSPLLGPTGPA